jgi:hypothetical protein
MPPSPSEFFFKRRKPFMERTVRDDFVALLASLAGFTAGYLLIGDDQPWVFAFVIGAGLLMIPVHSVIRHVVRRRRNAGSGFPPPE